MSVQDTAVETEQSTTDSELDRDPEYTENTVSAYGSIREAMRAFQNMVIKPSRTARRSKLRKSFDEPAYYHYASSYHAYQFPNGAGVAERTNRQRRGTVSIRCRDGTTISGPGQDVFYSYLTDLGYGIPDLRTQHEDTTDNPSRNNVVELSDGSYIVILYDRSAGRQGTRWAGFWVAPDDPRQEQVARILNRGDYANLSDIVAPDAVLASDLPVVDSKTYRRSNGRGNAGGYGDKDRVGECIIRQGEWYLIAKPDMSVPDKCIEKPLKGPDTTELGSHVPRDQFVADNTGPSLDPDVGPDEGVYVRGTLRHTDNEHAMLNVFETWHKVVENTEDMFVFERETRGRWE